MMNTGKIREMVYESTFYPSGKYRHYLSVVELLHLFDQILKTNETTEYILVTPFYITMDGQYELELYMFFCGKIENWENEDDLMRECEFDEGGNPYKGVIRFYKNDDLQAFQKAIKDYMSCMDTIVREIYVFLHKKNRVRNRDILLGSLCFEVGAESAVLMME